MLIRTYKVKQQKPKNMNIKKMKPKPQREKRGKSSVHQNQIVKDEQLQIQEGLAEASSSTKNRSIMPPLKSRAIRGVDKLVRSMVDPVANQGVDPPNFQIDNIAEQQLPMSGDNSFTVSINNQLPADKALMRIAQVASPIVTHLIYCDLGANQIVVVGAKTIVLNENVIGVLGNKIGYLGLLNDGTFTPSKEYLRYRILSCSDNITYTGKAINVNGNSYTAYIQSPLEIAEIS